MRTLEEYLNLAKQQKEVSPLIKWDCGSPLYDSYEIASLFNLIERRTMIFPSNSSSSSSSTILLQSSSSSSSSTVRFSSAVASSSSDFSLSPSSSSPSMTLSSWRRRFKPRESSTRNKEVNEEQEGSIIGTTTTGWRIGILSRKRKGRCEDEEIIPVPPHLKAKKKVKTNRGCFGFFR